MIDNLNQIIEAFLTWYENDQHSELEDAYSELKTDEYLRNLNRNEFIDYFFQFKHEGGKIQSGGNRTSGKFREMLESNFENFKKFILEPYEPNFGLDNWLKKVNDFSYFGWGAATIYLNRIDKNKFAIVNNKSQSALKEIGYKIKGDFLSIYHSIEAAQKDLIAKYPTLKNLYRTDALTHFLIGTEEGKKFLSNTGFNPNYWVFQCNPNQYDIFTEWQSRKEETWKVSSHKKDIKPEDKVILWVTGEKGGCYGLCTVTSEILNDDGEYVELDIDYNLVNTPILKEELLNLPEFSAFKGGYRGTNFSATKEQFEKILEMINSQTNFSNNELKVKNKKPEHEIKDIRIPQNLILYGPPGTGKTYNTINLALEICGVEVPTARKLAVQKFKKLMDEGQIVFTTFHQSMSYEDFVEGIKPVLVEDEENTEKTEMVYKNVDGIFKLICEKADEKEIIQENSLFKLSAKNQVYKVSLKSDNPSYNVKTECFEKDEIRIGWDDTGDLDNIFLKAQQNEVFEKLGKNDKNSIKYFYELKQGDVVLVFHDLKTIDGIGIVEDDSYHFNDNYPEFKHVRKVKWLSKFKPIRIFELNKETNLTLPTVYRLSRISVDDITKLIQEKEIVKSEQIEKNEKSYVLIIDEINRGNISKIFGELITLIEPDKRQGGENELEVVLPYSKSKFSVPQNLWIIGTMNTADRSIALIDTALRRRFDFREMLPDSKLLNPDIIGINLQLLLAKINERIEFLLDRDHTIGHSYFIRVKTKNDLCEVFRNKIIPLLQEYFYNDWEKIQLVLGDKESWEKPEEQKLIQIKKNYSVDEEIKLFGVDVEDYEDEKIYTINPALTSGNYGLIPPESFIHIYRKPEKQAL